VLVSADGEAAAASKHAAHTAAALRPERRNGSGRNRREPIRIPGADESRAPREWRQELMDAMREKAPERYNDEVRKYYEELVK
jgi:hypothetical protein